MLFKIDGTNAKILGTFHSLPKDEFFLPDGAWSLHDAAALIVLEHDPNDTSWTHMGMLQFGHSLAEHVSPDLLQKTKDLWKSLGQEGSVTGLKPWFAAAAVTAPLIKNAGFEHTLGIDVQIFQKSHPQKIVFLEKHEPYEAMDQSPLIEQVGLLNYFVSDPKRVRHEVATLYRAWRNCDLEFFEKDVAVNLNLFPVMFGGLLGARNRQWLPKILKIIEGGENALICVGTAHLVGKDGIQVLLKEHGFTLSAQ